MEKQRELRGKQQFVLLFNALSHTVDVICHACDIAPALERVLAVVCNDNIDWACAVIEQTAIDKANIVRSPQLRLINIYI